MTILRFPVKDEERTELEWMTRRRNVLFDAAEIVVDATTDEERARAIALLERALQVAGDPE